DFGVDCGVHSWDTGIPRLPRPPSGPGEEHGGHSRGEGPAMTTRNTAARSAIRTLAAGAVAIGLVWVVPGVAPAAPAVNAEQPHLVSANPADWTPNVTDGQVRAIAQVGSKMIVGGTFTQVQNAGSATTLTRNYLLAFNATTGDVDTTFVPALDGAVYALVAA